MYFPSFLPCKYESFSKLLLIQTVGSLKYDFQQNMPITHSSLIIPMLRRVQYSKTTKFSKELILFFAEYSILCGGTALFQARI